MNITLKLMLVVAACIHVSGGKQFSATCQQASFTHIDSTFVVLRNVVPDVVIDCKYATTENFTGIQLYPNDTLKIRKVVADSLSSAQRSLFELGLRLVVFDAYRPRSVQQILWKIMPDERYVANPMKGSRHNRGCAVDVTLCDFQGTYLDMGSNYDDFSERAHASYRNLPPSVLRNREFLIDVMGKHGFEVLPTEWWHFDFRGWEQFGIPDE